MESLQEKKGAHSCMWHLCVELPQVPQMMTTLMRQTAAVTAITARTNQSQRKPARKPQQPRREQQSQQQNALLRCGSLQEHTQACSIGQATGS
jgi:hypothetical protein